MKTCVLLVSALVLSVCAFEFEDMFMGTQACPKYECYTEEKKLDVCAKMDLVADIMSIKVRKCAGTDEICDMPESLGEEGICAKYYSTAKFYPGEYCRNDTECYSGSCVNNTCTGKDLGDDCLDDGECNSKFFCKDGKCAETLALKAACDVFTNKCKANLVCDNAECVKIGSKNNGENAMIPGACKSLYTMKGVCAPGPALEQGKEENPTACVYRLNNKENITETPMCGMTKTGKKFCKPGRGDVSVSNVF